MTAAVFLFLLFGSAALFPAGGFFRFVIIVCLIDLLFQCLRLWFGNLFRHMFDLSQFFV